jgi:hypothetical protein
MNLMKGKHWVNLGHREHNLTYIYPEEALFLIERGLLKLDFCDPIETQTTISYIEKAYQFLIANGHLSIDHLQVYMYLKRLGYIVLRCPETSLFTYKIYKPNSRFRKTFPGMPSFYLNIYRSVKNSHF